MLTGVTCSPIVLSWNFGISKIPIEFHITLKFLLCQETVENVTKVIVVGFVFEEEQAAVLKECMKLGWEPMEQGMSGDSLFTFENLLPLELQALPWKKAPKEVK